MSTGTNDERPDPGWDNPDPSRYAFKARPESANWRVCNGRRQCSDASGTNHRRCQNDAVLEYNRQSYHQGRKRDAWFAYCAEHTYGRWIEDGAVMWWALVPVDSASA